jgi:hypothetical protein
MCCVIIMYKNNWKDHIMRIKDTQQPKIAWEYQWRVIGQPKNWWNNQF